MRVTEIQVDYQGETAAPLAALVGKKVLAEGGIMERNLAGQHRPFILDVEPGHIKAGAFMLVPELPAEAAPPLLLRTLSRRAVEHIPGRLDNKARVEKVGMIASHLPPFLKKAIFGLDQSSTHFFCRTWRS